MIETYKPSGGFSMLTVILALIGAAVFAGLAFVYQVLLYWVPLIYLNFLLTAGVGFSGGLIGMMCMKTGRCRNVSIALGMGLVIGVSGLAAKHWFQYRQYKAEISDGFADFADQQGKPALSAEGLEKLRGSFEREFTFSKYVSHRVKTGWSIGRRGQGPPIKGAFVYVVWTIEAGIVLFFCCLFPFNQVNTPYNELLQQWADEEEIVLMTSIHDPAFVQNLQNAISVDELLQLPTPSTEGSNRVLKYQINSIAGQDMDSAYLSITDGVVTVGKDGDAKTDESKLYKYVVLSADKRKQFVAAAKAHKQVLEQQIIAENEDSLQDSTQSSQHIVDIGSNDVQNNL